MKIIKCSLKLFYLCFFCVRLWVYNNVDQIYFVNDFPGFFHYRKIVICKLIKFLCNQLIISYKSLDIPPLRNYHIIHRLDDEFFNE